MTPHQHQHNHQLTQLTIAPNSTAIRKLNDSSTTSKTVRLDDDDATTSGSNMSSFLDSATALGALAELAPVALTDFNIHQRMQEGSGFQVFKVQVNKSKFYAYDDVPKYFSLKCLKSKSGSKEQMEQEANLLKAEAKIIQRLRHPNIAKAIGLSSHSPYGYFLAYDLIEETLEDRIHAWKTGEPIKSGANRPPQAAPQRVGPFGNSKAHAPPLEERLFHCVLGVARAMMYLHSRHIVNPLRPNCIGFDRSGAIKIFDFSVYEEPTAELMRYMSPEYIESQQASYASDVYSLGIITWQVATLNEPFTFLNKFKNKPNTKERNIKIAKMLSKKRPETRGIPDKDLRALIKDCWDSNPDARPSATRLLFRLADCLPKQETHEQKMDRLEALLRSHESKMSRSNSRDEEDTSSYSGKIMR